MAMAETDTTSSAASATVLPLAPLRLAGHEGARRSGVR